MQVLGRVCTRTIWAGPARFFSLEIDPAAALISNLTHSAQRSNARALLAPYKLQVHRVSVNFALPTQLDVDVDEPPKSSSPLANQFKSNHTTNREILLPRNKTLALRLAS